MSENLTQKKISPISELFRNWFLGYSSYVILERAVPEVLDGLKPVQRRILHSLQELDDGRYNKAANIIGNTMKYHPHGDQSIGDALVQLGQKDLLVDTQGNWGNILTGDSAAAPRYIEARLTPFAKEVVFNPKTTKYHPSYDGRNKEPDVLPVKFPLVLAQGVEGIAVGLASKILPHNFNELIDACIAHLRGEEFTLYPDFPNGGKADCSKYNDGLRGGKVLSRAQINKLDNKTLAITEIPFSVTTNSLIESIVNANNNGKIKIKKIDDNTSAEVEILIHLSPGVSPDKTIDALYAFTLCEVSISPNSCVIYNGKPAFLGVSEILKISADNTLELLKLELEIKEKEILELLLYASLERIFIENRIYRDIEECTTWEDVIATIDKGLTPYKKDFYREITTDDIVKLTEIKIKKISRYDINKEEEKAKALRENLKTVKKNLKNIVDYTIDYYNNIKEKYGKGRERKTVLLSFEDIDVTKVAAATNKLYVNRKEGFAGFNLKKDEYVCDCSDIDDMLIINKDGKYKIKKVDEKVFVGEDVIYINVFRKDDERTIYNCIYQDGPNGFYYVKRFFITGLTRDKEYDITQGKPKSKIVYLNVRPNGEAETVKVYLKPRARLKKLTFKYDFSELAIKNKNSKGNIFSKNAIKRIQIKDEGISTLKALKIWFDTAVKKLNTEERGLYLGEYEGDDKIFYVLADGSCRLINFDLTNHFNDLPIYIKKYHPHRVYTVIYYSGEKKLTYVKRFTLEDEEIFSNVLDGHPESKLLNFLDNDHPRIALIYPEDNKSQDYCDIIELDTFTTPRSVTTIGKRLTTKDFEEILILNPYYPDRDILDNTKIETADNDDEDVDEDNNEASSKVENKDDIEKGDKDNAVDVENVEKKLEEVKKIERDDIDDDTQLSLF
ncbi:MAG: DNA gyrase/topoisomerase IV subunit A [Bacteroidales bacterium]